MAVKIGTLISKGASLNPSKTFLRFVLIFSDNFHTLVKGVEKAKDINWNISIKCKKYN